MRSRVGPLAPAGLGPAHAMPYSRNVLRKLYSQMPRHLISDKKRSVAVRELVKQKQSESKEQEESITLEDDETHSPLEDEEGKDDNGSAESTEDRAASEASPRAPGGGGSRVTPRKGSRDKGSGVRHCNHRLRAPLRPARRSRFVLGSGDVSNPYRTSPQRAIRIGGQRWRPSSFR